MNDLPVEISSLFITNEKMTANKAEILDFCDSIQDLVGTMRETEVPLTDEQLNQPSNQMEIFDFQLEPERFEQFESDQSGQMSVDSDTPLSIRGRSRGRGRCAKGVTRVIKKRGRPPKNLKPIKEVGESSDYNFLTQVDNSSRSSWSN